MSDTTVLSMQPMPVLTNGLGSLDRYIQAVRQFSFLTELEEVELGRRWQQSQDLEAARKLVLSHLRLVVSVSRQYLGYGLPQADLIQEGNIGLMKAVRRFDPERGVRLVSFALHWIKAEIHEYILRNWRLVKVATTKAQRKLFFNLRSLKAKTAALSSEETQQIAERLDVKPSDVLEMETRLSGKDVALDLQPDDDERVFAPILYLTAPESEPVEILAKQQEEARLTGGLAKALAALDDRSREIVQSRWLQEDGETSTLQELADRYGVSAERIRQIEQKALQRMKGVLVV